MSDKPWNPEVERIRRAMMERFSDKLSMEEIADFAYSVAGECTSPATQPVVNFVSETSYPGPSCSFCGAAMALKCLSCGSTSEQASPSRCPQCGSTIRKRKLLPGMTLCPDGWHLQEEPRRAADILLESVDRAIDSAAEKMTRKEFKKAAKDFNEVLDHAAKEFEGTSEQASYPNDPSLMCAEGRHKECTGSNQPWWVCGCACHKKASEQASPREFKPYMEDHEYYDPPQASPTPEEFPSRSQEKRIRTMRGEKKPLDPKANPFRCPTCGSKDQSTSFYPYCPDSWHSSAATQKGTKKVGEVERG